MSRRYMSNSEYIAERNARYKQIVVQNANRKQALIAKKPVKKNCNISTVKIAVGILGCLMAAVGMAAIYVFIFLLSYDAFGKELTFFMFGVSFCIVTGMTLANFAFGDEKS